jgi:hypothetical protein
MEQALAVLSGTDLSGPAKLEVIGLFTGAVRSIAQMEIEERRTGRDPAQWQDSVAAYLAQIVTAGQHPHLAAALADQPAGRPRTAGTPVRPGDDPHPDRAAPAGLTVGDPLWSRDPLDVPALRP